MGKKLVLIRQRPSIGDCLLLGPVIKEIKARHRFSHLTVITDPNYMGGGLVDVFKGMSDYVDRIEAIDSNEWTTDSNLAIDPQLGGAHGPCPPTVENADKVFDCNGAFMQYERDHGGTPPLGITDFWLNHFELDRRNVDRLPFYKLSPTVKAESYNWFPMNVNRQRVGMVLRAGDPVRDWNINDRASVLADWLHTSGYEVVTFDPILKTGSQYARACIGKQLPFVAGVMATCDLIVTPDTGLLHLAQAVGVKTLGLWGIMPPDLRVKGYDTTIIPREPRGKCQNQNCRQCNWRFQQWSCLSKLSIRDIQEGISFCLGR